MRFMDDLQQSLAAFTMPEQECGALVAIVESTKGRHPYHGGPAV